MTAGGIVMTQIVLNPDQVKVYQQATEPVQICDPHGKVLGTVKPEYPPEFIAELKRRAREPGKRYTSEQVTRHMKALADAWNREGPFDEKRLMEILNQLRAEDQK